MVVRFLRLLGLVYLGPTDCHCASSVFLPSCCAGHLQKCLNYEIFRKTRKTCNKKVTDSYQFKIVMYYGLWLVLWELYKAKVSVG